MIPLIETLRRSVPGVIGKELLTELWSTPWDTAMFKNIEGVGLAFGTNTGSQRSRNEDRIAIAHVTSISRELSEPVSSMTSPFLTMRFCCAEIFSGSRAIAVTWCPRRNASCSRKDPTNRKLRSARLSLLFCL
jgi:hypothetical protein